MDDELELHPSMMKPAPLATLTSIPEDLAHPHPDNGPRIRAVAGITVASVALVINLAVLSYALWGVQW